MQLPDLVKLLKLTGISETLESRLAQARDTNISYEKLLTMIFQGELENAQSSLYKDA